MDGGRGGRLILPLGVGKSRIRCIAHAQRQSGVKSRAPCTQGQNAGKLLGDKTPESERLKGGGEIGEGGQPPGNEVVPSRGLGKRR